MKDKYFTKTEIVFGVFVVVLTILHLAIGQLIFLKFFNLLLAVGAIVFLFLQRKEKIVSAQKEFSLIKIPQFQIIADQLEEGLIFYDEKFRPLFVNQSLTKIVELSKEDIMREIISPSMLKNPRFLLLAEIFYPVLTSQRIKTISSQPEIVEVWFDKPKELFLRIITFKFQTGEQKINCKIIENLTEKMMLMRQEEELLNITAHQIRTSLNQVRWLLESIIPSAPSDLQEVLNQALEVVVDNIFGADKILMALRSPIREIKLHLQEGDFGELVHKIVNQLQGKIQEKNLEVIINEPPTSLPKFYFDPQLIYLALFNLIENAIKYNKPNGKIIISYQKVKGRPYLECKISDTGVGIPKSFLPYIFHKFTRGANVKKSVPEGTGLGLYIVKQFIDLHGGEISVSSKEGEGATFAFTLPLDKSLIPR